MMRVRINSALRTMVLLLLIAAGVGLFAARRERGALLRPRGTSNVAATATNSTLSTLIREHAQPLRGSDDDYDALMAAIGDARFVLLGEATHGTHEFYRERARITRRLIEEKGFSAVAIEGDWPKAYRVNQYVRGTSGDASPAQALADFTDFPVWMWRNHDVRDLVQWLRAYNDVLTEPPRRVGFYGLDLYSIFSSADAVVRYLEQVDPAAAQRARSRYACFARFDDDPHAYGSSSASNQDASCEDEALQQLQELQQRAASPALPVAPTSQDDLFSALQNARVVKHGEAYYRTLYSGEGSTWNLRDSHMVEVLVDLAAHFDAPGKPGKVVAWAHNTHMGDASATQLGESGEWNVGQLMRQRDKESVALVGFTTYTGTVMAAPEWGEPGERKDVRPALPESYSGVFHDAGIGNALLLPGEDGELADALAEPRLQRAIGVVYLPQSERMSHYFQARLSKQFDAVIHIDVTRAVEPLTP